MNNGPLDEVDETDFYDIPECIQRSALMQPHEVAKGSMIFDFCGRRVTVYGGPYHKYNPNWEDVVGIKMAEEIDQFCHIDIPTQDFSVPNVRDVAFGLHQFLAYMNAGCDTFYVGCMGGIGRTGLFLAILARLEDELFRLESKPPVWQFWRWFEKWDDRDPVKYVRALYYSHAVETGKQQWFIYDFPIERAAREFRSNLTN